MGANAATGNAKAILVNGQVADRRHGLLERLTSLYREHVARTRAEELARVSWTDDAWHWPSASYSGVRDLGSTPLRGIRLT